jgi:hypothetical protein
MDPAKFDEFTKELVTPSSRRQALKTLAASAFGGMLAFSGLDRVFAKTGHCPPGLKLCQGKCVNTRTDPKNCGVCGTVCVSGLCVNGLCCPPGTITCNNSCCDGTCLNGTTCCPTGQTCGTTCCPAGQVCLNGTTCCPTKQACGTTCCPAGMICQNRQCVVPPCPSGCFNPCNQSGTCYCNITTEGTSACVQPICLTGPCASSAECPPGSICSNQGCCGSQPFCIPLCNTSAPATSVRTYGAAR